MVNNIKNYSGFRKIFVVIFVFMALGLSRSVLTQAQTTDTLIYDTSNHYLGECGYTDTTTFTLDKDLDVSLFQVWYMWNSGEGPLAFTVKKDEVEFLSGDLTRSSCDPYQTAWCNGDLRVNKVFPIGSYEVKVANSRKCAVPSGNGAVRLYTAQAVTPTGIVTPTTYITQQPTVTVVPTVTDTECEVEKDGINIIYPVAVISGLLNIGFLILIVKRR